jgi:alpha-tubulin suppressor-like RCC1 family protein
MPSRIVAISAGASHTCALNAAGTVTCWGDNSEGQLGDGTRTNRSIPIAVTGLPVEIIAVAAGGGHTCALDTAGAIWCWGDNVYGQLGDDTRTDSLIPVAVAGLSGPAAAVGTGEFHSCALMAGGSVECWGWNDEAQLGDVTGVMRMAAVTVAGIRDAATLAVGARHNCVINILGQVQCWGGNWEGQIGDGSGLRRYLPETVTSLSSRTTAIAAGNTHTCALAHNGSIACWGGNSNGQLGDGTTTNRLAPVETRGWAGPVMALAAGGGHTCALLNTRAAHCLGGNWKGQLGDGTIVDQPSPTPVTRLPQEVMAITAGEAHTCALTTAGQVQCWGNNNAGQLGDGTTTSRPTPANVISGP